MPSRKLVRSIAKSGNKVVYPVFEMCLEYIDDPFWRDKFNQASMGKLPPNYAYNNSKLIFRKKSKVIMLNVPSYQKKSSGSSSTQYSTFTDISQNDDIEKISLDIIEFFRKTSGFQSKMDCEINKKKEEDSTNNRKSINNWNNIRKRKTKEALINWFVEEYRINEELSYEECLSLTELIYRGISLGYFNNNNLVIENEIIKDIENLSFNRKIRSFEVSDKKIAKTKVIERKEPANKTQDPYLEKWSKYIDKITPFSDVQVVYCQ